MKRNAVRMPAEWEEHERTIIQWPVREALIHPKEYDEVIKGYYNTVKAIAEFEPVTILCNPDDRPVLPTNTNFPVDTLSIPHSDGWFRDNGPTYIKDEEGRLSAVKWGFNAWGNKYVPCDKDQEAALHLLKKQGIPYDTAPFVLEGGSIHSDGQGTILTTKECLLNKNRNPHMKQEEIEAQIKAFLGVKKIIWLDEGVFGDETDGHVDNIACFAPNARILLQTSHNRTNPNYERSEKNRVILNGCRNANEEELELIEIEAPNIREYDNTILALSYLNFYIVNGGIILPVFGKDAEETDQKAAEVIQKVFPERKLVTVDGMPLIKEGGNVHCITQQMPLGKYERN